MKFIIGSDSLKDYEINKVKFLIEKLHLLQSKTPAAKMKTAISLYFYNINCYQALTEYLNLPLPNRTESSFRALDTPDCVTYCRNRIKNVFNKLPEKQKYCKVVVDKSHIKTCCEIPRKPYYRILTC